MTTLHEQSETNVVEQAITADDTVGESVSDCTNAAITNMTDEPGPCGQDEPGTKSKIIIFSDASFCPMTREAAGAFMATTSQAHHVTAGTHILPNLDEAFEAELMIACKAVLHVAKNPHFRKQVEAGASTKMILLTDCVEVMRVFQKTYDPNLPEQIFTALYEVRELVERTGVNFRVYHIKAHTDNVSCGYLSNKWCDEACRALMRAVRHKRDTVALQRQHGERSRVFIGRLSDALGLKNMGMWESRENRTNRHKAARAHSMAMESGVALSRALARILAFNTASLVAMPPDCYALKPLAASTREVYPVAFQKMVFEGAGIDPVKPNTKLLNCLMKIETAICDAIVSRQNQLAKKRMVWPQVILERIEADYTIFVAKAERLAAKAEKEEKSYLEEMSVAKKEEGGLAVWVRDLLWANSLGSKAALPVLTALTQGFFNPELYLPANLAQYEDIKFEFLWKRRRALPMQSLIGLGVMKSKAIDTDEPCEVETI